MSVFHRVDDINDLSGPKFYRLAVRLTAYTGVMQARVEALRQEEEEGTGSVSPAQRAGSETTRSATSSSSRAIREDSPEMLNAIHAHSGKGANLFKVTKVPRKEEPENS
jgi:hypothetical protein